MRRSIAVATAYRPSILGLLLGGVVSAAVAAVVFGGAAVAHTDTAAGAVLEASHLPPLLVVPGEPVELAFEVHCAQAGVEDPERSCHVGGSLFLRRGTTGAFRELPLARNDAGGLTRLTTTLPDALANESYQYYA